jgi:outer membrane protein assembly factor BamA
LKDKNSTCLLLLSLILLVWSTRNQTAAQVDDPAEEKLLRIAAIGIDGNEKTLDRYVFLELTFAAGDSLTISALEKKVSISRTNLVNTSLFLNHMISIDWFYISDDDLLVVITLQERWYLWPEPVLQNSDRNFNNWLRDRDFGQLSYGINLIRENFRGRNERLTFILQGGFDEKYEVTWHAPALRGGRDWGLGAGAGFQRNRRIAWGETGNRLLFASSDSPLLEQQYGYLQMNIRPSLRHFHTFRLTGFQFNIADLPATLNPGFSPGNARAFFRLNFDWVMKVDHRDQRAYPLKGYYLDAQFRQQAIHSTLSNDKTSSSLEINARRFFHLADRWHFGAGFTGFAATDPQPPFMFRYGLGYQRNFVRGYEYYTVHGSRWVLFRENLKFTLVPEKKLLLPFMPHEKFREGTLAFYLNLFSDAGYVYALDAAASPLNNRWLTSFGVGLDMVTYYDKVLRIEWTLNNQRDAGVFVHFVAPI